MTDDILLDARDLVMDFSGTRAVDGVSLELRRGATFGLVGESGCGKSTLTSLLLGLRRPTSGTVRFRGTELGGLSGTALRRTRRHMQMVLQDPVGSLNRRKTVAQIIALPLEVHGEGDAAARRARVGELLDLVGLPSSSASRRPGELSGGQCQRVGIARAIALHPDLVVLDEAVSAIDVATQAQILNLLRSLQTELGLTYLFVSHDLAVVRYMAPEIAVMHEGRIVERASRDDLFTAPREEYTRTLIDAIPRVPVRDDGADDGAAS
ncbi:MAG TPA: ATP-binding cassette domain-containing protein [Streptosporangiaceae bacterium]|jgi:ABC-type glutathione transport system ATPase component